MSVLTLPVPIPPSGPRRKRWTVKQFHAIWEQGWLNDCRPALLDGEIVEMPNPGPLHNMSVTLGDYALKNLFSTGFVVRVQMPLVLSLWTDPVPDLAVVRGVPQDFVDNPTSAVLVVEAADSSLATDLGEKTALYAATGIEDYWVIDLQNRQLIVHRDPMPDKVDLFRSIYRDVRTLQEADDMQPLAAGSVIRVADLLPRR